jgi:hypothetical protein
MAASSKLAGMSVCGLRLQPIGTSVGHVLVMIAALAGLFAMHGLSDHGIAGPEAVVALGGSASMTQGSDAMTVTGHVSGMGAEAPGQRPIQNDHGMGLAGLCLAVLVAVLLIGLSIRRRGLRPLSVSLPHWRPTRLVLARPGPLRPPELLALSIQRC